jgi:hypothetical protein
MSFHSFTLSPPFYVYLYEFGVVIKMWTSLCEFLKVSEYMYLSNYLSIIIIFRINTCKQ